MRMTLVVCALVFMCGSAFGDPVIDGRFTDWGPATLLAVDPPGDNTDTCDVTQLRAQSRGTELFVMMDLGAVVNVQSGATSTEVPIVEIELANGDDVIINMRERRVDHVGLGNPVPLDQSKLTTGPTYAADRVEVRIELGPMGAQVGDTIRIGLSGSDVVAPVGFTLSDPAAVPGTSSADRLAHTSFRVASINTRVNGTLDETRRPRLVRLARSARADVYCFEEEWDTSAASIAGFLGAADPFGDGAPWNVHKINGAYIASRSNVIPISSFNSRYAAAVVELPAGDVCVLAIHPKCCGYIGSSEDEQRISQTQGMIQTMDALRASHFGIPYRNAPIVITGDWNLVGSRTPLTMLESAPGHGIREWLLPHLSDDEVYTWIGGRTGPGDSRRGGWICAPTRPTGWCAGTGLCSTHARFLPINSPYWGSRRQTAARAITSCSLRTLRLT